MSPQPPFHYLIQPIKYTALTAFSTLLLAAPAAAGERAPADWIPGATHRVRITQVIDGDTLRVKGKSGTADVRIYGIDAPEWNQTCTDGAGVPFACGASATGQMVEILHATPTPCSSSRMHGQCVKTSLPVECTVLDIDRRWGRPVARCIAGRDDVGRAMVTRGYARASYAHDYSSLAATARALKQGLWAGQFTDPAEIRHRNDF